MLGERVVAGSIDRLLVTEADVLAVEYKTGSRVPADAASVPPAHVAQLGAYAAALALVFPGRAVRAALLYTAGPQLIELPAAMLADWQAAIVAPAPDSTLQPGDPMPILPA